MIPLIFFSVSVKFGTCYITGQRAEFRIKKANYAFIYFFGIFWLFFILKFVFRLFSFLFLMKCQTFATEYEPIINKNRWPKIVNGTA